ncbi:MAG: PAS domain-containing protein [Caldilinea sp. CFX5]|nr:PAS domain-containing protein [Caldilinea sp. CFX5]
MRRSQVSDLLTITALFLLLLGGLAGWGLAVWFTRPTSSPLAWALPFGLCLLVTGSGIWLYRFGRAWFLHIKALQEEAHLMLYTNPDRRARPQGTAAVRTLAATINEFADKVQALQRDRDAAIRQARADLEEEHQRLAAILAELTDGVIVCTLDGRILLYNQQARHLLNTPTHSSGGFIGLGRSIFGVLDRNAISYGLSHLQSRAGQPATGEREQSAGFMTATTHGALLRVRMAALLDYANEITGFVLTLQDMTQGITASSRRDFLLQRLTERFRGGLANIRVAIETLEQFPALPAPQLTRFQQIISDESTALSSELDQTMREFADDLRAQWRHETMAAADLLGALQHHLAKETGVTVESALPAADLWLRVDNYAIVHGLTTALRDLQVTFGVTQLHLGLQPLPLHPDRPADKQRRFATLDVRWSSRNIAVEAWLDWKERASTVDAGDATFTLREVAERHGSELWFQHDPATAQSYFRLLLPLAASRPVTLARPINATPVSRPEYYDFNLFPPESQPGVLADRPLSALTYTVFDTETTGLDPTQDRIVSIGAVRIVNGRPLRQELFDQLVDPERPMPAAAEEVHGITDQMVRGQPTIQQVLPHFMRFAEETVLVGHNVAFDLRLFETEEAVTGVKVNNPVLDTLLLSAVIHPDGDNHSIEALADRLGVTMVGRHTALGDAFVTAEIFLRMIPLLHVAGITTLGQAINAAQQTYFARLKY